MVTHYVHIEKEVDIVDDWRQSRLAVPQIAGIISEFIKVELYGKMKSDIFQNLGFKLHKKTPLLSFLPITNFNPLYSPLKYEKIKRESPIAYKFIFYT